MHYEVGAVIDGIVVDVVKFGAFVKLDGGKTGLVHISQISDKYVQEIGEFVSVGAKVRVKLISIDDKGRIQLSMKAVPPEEEARLAEREEGAEKRESQRREPRRERSFEDEPPRAERRREGGEDDSFDRKLKMFLKQSEDRLVDVKRSIDAKRGVKKKKTK